MEWLGRLKATGAEPCPRKGHSMTRLLDSPLVLVFGGEMGSGKLLNDMYCLNVDTKVWRKVTYVDGPHPLPRLLHTATPISSSSMIIMGGDRHFPNNTVGPARDVWSFDIRTCSWREIATTDNIPTRSGHTAVFGNSPGQVPAIYVFGGFTRGSPEGSAVYRLRIGDLKWESLPVVVTGSDGEQRVVEKPTTASQSKEGNAREEDFPCPRESHAAIWLPTRNGMFVVGGDTGYAVTDDCWLFVPSPQYPGAWKWRRLNFRVARGLASNKLPGCAGMICVLLPTEKTQVLLWGGIVGPVGDHAMPPNKVYLLDLDAMQSTCIIPKGTAPEIGRLLHGFVRVGNSLLAFGGCDNDGAVLKGLEYARLLDKFKSAGLRATDFGREAAEVAAQGVERASAENGFDNGNSTTDKRDSEGEEEELQEVVKIPLMGPPTIPKGTPLSGRILDETDYGYFVSVIINGKLYKGVLVANPLKQSEVTEKEKERVEQPQKKAEETRREKVFERSRNDNEVKQSGKGPEKRQKTGGEKVGGQEVGKEVVEIGGNHEIVNRQRANSGSKGSEKEEDVVATSPEAKRRRIDPKAAALPDSPPRQLHVDAKAAALPDSPPGRRPIEQDEVIDIT